MEFNGFAIKEMQILRGAGRVRGVVEFTFQQEALGGPVFPAVRVGCFVNHDAQASLETLERELLAEAHRLLSEALAHSGKHSPTEIRQAVDEARAGRDARQSEESDASLTVDLKIL